ncbi:MULTISPECIES: sulfatase family protein [unclassified Polaribacter]|uniref:sulfatase family protein n=1 Tax=unclassified Polaribacter TaxID=196858 RepID=UPI000068C932|nr:sulfatase [Polaribacter sp. MED152]EAQ41124.1 sulfatase [Polaribacter sp. MED152]
MKPIRNIFFLIVIIVLYSCINQENSKSVSEVSVFKKPNFLFIITDDHAYQALSAYDNKLINTPHIDRLANEGMLFKKAFVTNSICSPSRAVALTGKFSHLNSVRDNLDVFDTLQVTFPKLLQKNGYETAIYGKWHLKSKPKGFDFWEVLPDQGHYYHPNLLTKNGIKSTKGYVTDVITDRAINYLDSIRNIEKPFMLMYNHKAPHRQWWPSMHDLEDFKYRKIPVPETLFDDYKTKSKASFDAEMRISDHMALSADNKIDPKILKKLNYNEFLDWYESSYIERFNRLNADEQKQWKTVYGPINKEFEKLKPKSKALTLWKYQRYLEDYLGVIKSVDRNIGRVLDYLDKNNLAKNTMVIYTSDQGFFLGEHGWFDKRFMYEESFRTPLLIKFPNKIKPKSINYDLVQNIDFAPTILDVARVDIPKEMQGKSLVPLFKNNNSNWRDALYYHYYEYPGIHMVKRHYGVRTNRYKLIKFYYDVEAWEMYDLQEDPNEMKNIYGDSNYKEIQLELHKKLEELRVKYKDSDSLNQNFIESDLKRLKTL